ncbi:MAG TPA: hypothetical protein VN370_00830 [Desulfitobacteriaceae bacterium]|jgi:hypothetical protein|nr:hypothetical protein [Desulfitobacteriaceae bacterium]
MSIGQQLLDVPFPQMISSLGLAIAQSQYNLDKNSIEILKIMGDKSLAPVFIPKIKVDASGDLVTISAADGTPQEDEIETSMIGAGFQPTFYQFAETIIEVKIAITISYESSYENTTKGNVTTTTSTSKWWGYSSKTVVTSTPVDAKYSSKYNYTAEGSSLLRTRLVPMPPNPFMQRLLDMKAQAIQLGMELEMKKAEYAMEVQKARIAQDLKNVETAAQEKIDILPPVT